MLGGHVDVKAAMLTDTGITLALCADYRQITDHDLLLSDAHRDNDGIQVYKLFNGRPNE
jgi:hypothetical protein